MLTLFASLCFTPHSIADYRDSVDHHVQCRDDFSTDKDKCNQLLGKAMQKPTGSKAERALLDKAIDCHNQAYEDLDRCRDPKIIRTFVKDKKWRKEHKAELDELAKEFESADDKCTKMGKKGVAKCEKVKAKKRNKCLKKESKKFDKCLKKAEKNFLKKLKKLKPPK
jgi:hypothetical protein